MDKKLRRFRNALVINGWGIVAFGVWSVIKLILIFISNPPSFEVAETDAIVKIISKIFLIAALIIVITCILSIHLYIGRSASREGINGKRGSFYLVAAVFVFLILLCEMVLYFVPDESGKIALIGKLAAFFIDLTKTVIMVDTLYSAFMSRKLANKLENQR